MRKSKKVIILLGLFFIIGSGVLASNAVYQNTMNAESRANNWAFTTPTFNDDELINVAGNDFKIGVVYNGRTYAIQNSNLGPAVTYADAYTKIKSLSDNLQNTKEFSKLSHQLLMTERSSLQLISGNNLVYGDFAGERLTDFTEVQDYWVNKDFDYDESRGFSEIITSSGIYAPRTMFQNGAEFPECTETKWLDGLNINDLEVPAKDLPAVSTEITYYYELNFVSDNVSSSEYYNCAVFSETSDGLLKCEDLGSKHSSIPVGDTYAMLSKTQFESSQITFDTEACYAEAGGFLCIKPNGMPTMQSYTSNLPDGKKFNHYIKGKQCSAKTYPAGKAATRALLLTKKLDNVAFRQTDKAINSTLSTKPTNGAYLVANDTSLKANKLSDTTTIGTGELVTAPNVLSITHAEDEISIPIDISGSTFETEGGLTSTPVVAVSVTDASGVERFGRITTTYDQANTTLVGKLKISDLVEKDVDGTVLTDKLSMTVYNYESISDGSSDKYMDFISDGFDIEVHISPEVTLASASIFDPLDTTITAWGAENTVIVTTPSDVDASQTGTYEILNSTNNVDTAAPVSFSFNTLTEGTISNLPNGEYDLKVDVLTTAGRLTKTVHMRVDVANPTIALVDPDITKKVGESVELEYQTAGLSGATKVEIASAIDANNNDLSLTGEVFTQDATDKTLFKRTINKNGTYTFKVTGYNGLTTTSSPVVFDRLMKEEDTISLTSGSIIAAGSDAWGIDPSVVMTHQLGNADFNAKWTIKNVTSERNGANLNGKTENFTISNASYTIANLPEGEYDLEVVLTTDYATEITKTVHLRIDTTNPVMTFVDEDINKKVGETQLLQLQTEALSGIEKVEIASAVDLTSTDLGLVGTALSANATDPTIYETTISSMGSYTFKITSKSGLMYTTSAMKFDRLIKEEDSFDLTGDAIVVTGSDTWGNTASLVMTHQLGNDPFQVSWEISNVISSVENINGKTGNFEVTNGTYTMNDIYSGEYDLTLKLTTDYNTVITKVFQIRLDTEKPSLEVVDDKITKYPKASVDLDINVFSLSGTSGVKLIKQVDSEGAEVAIDPSTADLTKVAETTRSLSNPDTYRYTVSANGTYTFEATGQSGFVSDPFNITFTEIGDPADKITVTGSGVKPVGDPVFGNDATTKGTFPYYDILDSANKPTIDVPSADGLTTESKEFTVNADGSFTLSGLPDGEYDMVMKFPVIMEGLPEVIEKIVHIQLDTVVPVITIHNYDEINKVKKSVDMQIRVAIPSGVKKLTLTRAIAPDGTALAGLNLPQEITAKWTPEATLPDTDFLLTVDKAGYYSFEVEGNNGLKSTLKDVNLTKISDGIWGVESEAVTYSDQNTAKPVKIFSDVDGDAQWAANRVEISLNTTGAIAEAITWYYAQYDPNDATSVVNAPVWKPVVDADGNPTDKFHVDESGIYYYRFKAITKDSLDEHMLPDEVTDANLAVGNYYKVQVDKTAPNTPQLDLPADVNYDGTIWYNATQNVKASFTPSNTADGSLEELYYRYVDRDGNAIAPDWTAYPTNADDTQNFVAVSQEGEHRLQFMVKDILGRESATIQAYINLDISAPVMKELSYGTNKITSLLNTITFGAFFKDYVEIKATATDGIGGSLDSFITYQYVKFSKDEAQLDAGGVPQVIPTEAQWANGRSVKVGEDFNGIIMMRAIDRSGNTSATWWTDGITIDRLGPQIVFHDLNTDWTDQTTLDVTITDGGIVDEAKSGIKDGSVSWFSEATGVNTPLTLDPTGNTTITGLENGQYNIIVTAQDKVGHVINETREVKVDTEYPGLRIEGHDPDVVSKSEVLTLLPSSVGSGIKEINWSINGVEQTPITSFLADGSAKVTITTNGFYSFTVTSNAGRTSAPATLDVKNLSNAKPMIEIQPRVGSSTYTAGEWVKDNVSTTIVNKTQDLYRLKMYYRVFQKNGNSYVDITPKTGETYTDKASNVWAQTDSVVSASTTGEYMYYFMAIATTKEQSNVEVLNVRIDKNEPPVVTVEKEATYLADAWFATNQNLVASYVDANEEVSKTMEYKLDNGGWTTIDPLDKLAINTNGKHTVSYRVSDALGRVSPVKTVYVNVDTTTPSFTYSQNVLNGTTEINFTTTLGASGIKTFTIQKEGSADINNITSDMATVSEAGTYIVTLESKAGKKSSQTITVTSLSSAKPSLKVDVLDGAAADDADETDDTNPDIYVFDGTTWNQTGSKWSDHSVKVRGALLNLDMLGNVTWYVNQDDMGWRTALPNANGDLILTLGNEADYENVVTYQIKAVNDSGIESDVKKVTINIDKKGPATFNVNNTEGTPLVYNRDKFTNTTQTISTSFISANRGSGEWLEYHIEDDQGNVIADKAKQDTYTLNASGIYSVSVKSIDAMGRIGQTSQFTVKIDKEIPTELTASVAGNTFKEFLNNVTLGLFFQDTEDLTLSANFGVSATGTIHYQHVTNEADYQRPEYASAWTTYTNPITLAKDSYGIYYFYAVDDAGNRSAVYKTDGLTVDSVAPSINVLIPNSGSWSDQPYIEVTTDGDTTENAMAGSINKGFKDLAYTSDEDEPQSGNIAFDQNGYAKIPLHDGTYEVSFRGKDYAGNEVVVNGVTTLATPNTFQIQIDTIKPTLVVSGHNETASQQKEVVKIDTTVGLSGYWKLDETGAPSASGTKTIKVEKVIDGISQSEGLTIDEAKGYVIDKNGTYTFSIQNNVGVSASETIVVNNLSDTSTNMNITMKHDDGAGTSVTYDEDTWSATAVNVNVVTANGGEIKYRSDAQSAVWQDSVDGNIIINKEGITDLKIRLVKNSTIVEEKTIKIKVDTIDPSTPYVINKEMIELGDMWYKDTQNVKADMVQDLNGCKEWIQYSLDQGTTWLDGDNVNVTMPGSNKVMFRAIDELGRTASDAQSEVTVKIDITAPTSLKVNLQEEGSIINAISFGYFKKNQKVVATANFSDSGADSFEYQLVKKGETFDTSRGWKKIKVTGNGNVEKELAKLENGFDGVVYVRARDKAGNTSAVVNTGSVGVDTIAPVINAQDMTTWSSSNTLIFSVSDDMSGIEQVSYVYTPAAGTPQSEKVVTVKETGETTISNLANGEGTIAIRTRDKAGNETIKTIQVMIDSIKPVLTLTQDGDSIKANVNYSGASGTKRVIVYGNKIVETDITASKVDEADGTATYTYLPPVSGTYYVKVETNAGNNATESLEITSISTAKPVLKVAPKYTQSDKKGQAYTAGEWASGNIDVTISNVADGVETGKFFYTIYKVDGTTEVQAEKEITSSNTTYLQEISLEGTHIVSFRAVSKDGIESDKVTLEVKIDRSTPKTPTVTDSTNYTQDKWYNTPQTIEASFVANVDGAKETLMYNIDGEMTTEHQLIWREYPVGGIAVDEEGQHTIRFRVAKANGAISSESTPAYVNLDLSQPIDMSIHMEDKSYRHLLNSLTFGSFFKDTSEVTITGNFDISGLDRIEYAIVQNPADDASLTIPADDAFETYNGGFFIDPNVETIIFAKGYDKAGNKSDVIYSDRITIDNIQPVITFPDYPSGNSNKWLTDNSLKVQAIDDETGIEKVSYEAMNGTVFSGEAVAGANDIYLITNIPNGSNYLAITALDNAGNTHTEYFAISVDTIAPQFTITRSEQDNRVDFSILESSIVTGPSGVKDLIVSYTNKDGVVYSETLVAEAGKYSFSAYEEAVYTFTLSNKAGATAIKVEDVKLSEHESGIKVSPNVTESTWIDQSTLIFEAWATPRDNVVRYSYTTPDGTVVEDNATLENTHQFQLSTSGKYEFTFKSYNKNDLTTPVETRVVPVWLDNDQPNAPILPSEYDEAHWYNRTQRVTGVNNKTSFGSDELMQYRIDPVVDTPWVTGPTATIDPSVSGYGTHIVEYRVVDEVNHTSPVKQAIVNVTNGNDLLLSVSGNTIDAAQNVALKMKVTTGDAPLKSLTIKNTLYGETINIDVDKTVVKAAKNYQNNLYRNGTYLISATDMSGASKEISVDVNNIQAAATDLTLTMRDSSNKVVKSNEWSSSDLSIKASNTASASTAGIFYQKDGDADWTRYSSAIKVSEEGSTTYNFKLTQASGDITKTIVVKIDKTAPLEPTIKNSDQFLDEIWYSGNIAYVEGEVDALDTGSIQSLYYRIDEGAWSLGSIARVSGNGSHKVEYKTIDEAGNESTIKSATVNLDAISPILTDIHSTKNVDTKKYDVQILASDENKIDHIYYQLVQAGSKPNESAYNEVTPTLLTSGADAGKYMHALTIADTFNGYIYAYTTDLAGNKSAIQRSNLVDADYSIPSVIFPNSDMVEWTRKNEVSVYVDFGTSGAQEVDAIAWQLYDTVTESVVTTPGFSGVLNASRGTGEYTISLPEGSYSYRLMVKAINKVGNSSENNRHVMIDTEKPVINASAGDFIEGKRGQYIEVSVTYAGVNLKPDALFVKKEDGISWSKVDYNAFSGKASYLAQSNGTYYFKAVKTTSKDDEGVISSPVEISDIQLGDNEILLSSYIKFLASGEVCGVQNNCIIDNYPRNIVSGQVSIGVIDWEELNQKMNEQNLKLQMALRMEESSVQDFQDITWNGQVGDLQAMKLASFTTTELERYNNAVFRLVDKDSEEVVEGQKECIKTFRSKANGSMTINTYNSDVVRMNAYQPYNIPVDGIWQVTPAGSEAQAGAWKMSDEVLIPQGNYTLHYFDETGELQTQDLETTSSVSQVRIDPMRSFLKAITFQQLYQDNASLQITSDLTDIQIKLNDTWMPYEEGMYIDEEVTMMEIKGTTTQGTSVSEYIHI